MRKSRRPPKRRDSNKTATEKSGAVQIILQLGDWVVDLLTEGYAIKFVEHGFVEAFDDTVRLRALCLRSGVINIFDREVEFIFVMPGIAAIVVVNT
jgi:hypothetical protein